MTTTEAVANGITDELYGALHNRLDHLCRRVKKGHPRGFNWVMSEVQRISDVSRFGWIPPTFYIKQDKRPDWRTLVRQLEVVGAQVSLRINIEKTADKVVFFDRMNEKHVCLVLLSPTDLGHGLKGEHVSWFEMNRAAEQTGRLTACYPQDLALLRIQHGEALEAATKRHPASRIIGIHSKVACVSQDHLKRDSEYEGVFALSRSEKRSFDTLEFERTYAGMGFPSNSSLFLFKYHIDIDSERI
jgi:hypothetical protein